MVEPDAERQTPPEELDEEESLELEDISLEAPSRGFEVKDSALEESSFQDIALVDSGKVMLALEEAEDKKRSQEDSPAPSAPTASAAGMERHASRSPVMLGEYVGKKDLLLRLIKSDYFDAWIGLAYLWKYDGKDVGLQYFLCERMKERPMGEIEFVLPQICHMLVFNSEESVPLECFLLDVCQHSLHASIFTLWFLENYLVDLRAGAPNSIPEREVRFDRCARLLQEVQLAIWGDLIKPVRLRRLSKEYAEADEEMNESLHQLTLVDTMPGVEATLVGFGLALGAFASPAAALAMRPLVMMEARKRDRFKPTQQHGRPIKPLKTVSGGTCLPVSVPMANSFPSIEDLSQGRAFSLRDAITRTARQMKHPAGNTQTEHAMPPIYYHPEMHFAMGLIDVSRRLCHVAKDGRQQALLAELSLLNHNLPASLCVPLWCHGCESSAVGSAVQHHRLLRIPAGEAVILNSAERVPFVIYIEIVKDMEASEFAQLLETDHRGVDPAFVETAVASGLAKRSHSQPIVQSKAEGKTLKTPPLTPTLNKTRKSTIGGKSAKSQKVPTTPTIASRQLLEQPVDGQGFAERMRTAAIMLAQLTRQATAPGCPPAKLADIEAIKAKLIAEMEGLEKSRLLDALQDRQDSDASPYSLDDKQPVKDDPSAAVFREAWEDKRARIRQASPYGHLSGWDLLSVIVKSGADMRQEQLACQLIEEMHDIWNMAGLPIWVCPFRILVAAAEGGLVETVRNALSVHSIRKAAYTSARAPDLVAYSLRDHFIKTFGSPDSDSFINARDAFVKSLAGYSLVTYILQLKDRHNGNILIDSHGHMIHIDFGFMLANSPGGYYGFESAPFKLSSDYIDLLGGLHSEPFTAFKDLVFAGFMALRKHADRLILLLDVAQKDSSLPCFGAAGPSTIAQLRQRFQLGMTEAQVALFVERMITGSAYNVFTRLYDSFQYYSNGIL